MALVATRTHVDIEGNSQVYYYDLTFTSVTGGRINTGMANVRFAEYVPGTSDKHGITYVNYSDAGATSAAGSVYVDGVTANDTGKLRVVGTA